MNYAYLTREAFEAKMYEYELAGGVNVEMLRIKYERDILTYDGEKVNVVHTIFEQVDIDVWPVDVIMTDAVLNMLMDEPRIGDLDVSI